MDCYCQLLSFLFMTRPVFRLEIYFDQLEVQKWNKQVSRELSITILNSSWSVLGSRVLYKVVSFKYGLDVFLFFLSVYHIYDCLDQFRCQHSCVVRILELRCSVSISFFSSMYLLPSINKKFPFPSKRKKESCGYSIRIYHKSGFLQHHIWPF